MRFIHLADIHLGKKLFGFDLYDEQKYFIDQLIWYSEQLQIDAVLISGDVFDRGENPTNASLHLYEYILNSFHERSLPVYIIAGNHDSATRIEFAQHIFSQEHIYISGAARVDDNFPCMHEQDGVQFWLMPYIDNRRAQAYARLCNHNDQTINFQDCASAYKAMISYIMTDARRNEQCAQVLLSHQFVCAPCANPLESDSEDGFVGAAQAVHAQDIESFDYVALGHLHRPQYIYQPYIRYAGTPLAYSFSEAAHEKFLHVVEILPHDLKLHKSLYSSCPGYKQTQLLNTVRCDVYLHSFTLKPLRNLKCLSGTLEEIICAARLKTDDQRQDYVSCLLHDSAVIPHAFQRIQAYYPRLCHIEYKIMHQQQTTLLNIGTHALELPPRQELDQKNCKRYLELFENFYHAQTHEQLSTEDKDLIEQIFLELL